ncbi:uncharacterized protein DS421_17g598690 [Arachis hypogaea]|nr:uncharacterized protein DS421_17g598690 [Arachis hypogaea]
MARQAGHDGDINRLNETSHYAGTADFERPRLLLPRRVNHTLLPPDAIVLTRGAMVSGDAHVSSPVGSGDYHPAGRGVSPGPTCTREPRWGCLRNFGRWYNTETWAMVEQLLSARPPVVAQQAA